MPDASRTAGGRRFDLVIFDWDGTLADSLGAIVTNMQAAIAAVGLPPRSDQQVGELVGLGFSDGLRRLFPDRDPAEVLQLLATYRRGAPNGAFSAPLFPGAAQTLHALQAAGYRLAVATGKTRQGLVRSLEHHAAIAALFEHTRCADETAEKPHPRMLEEILDATGIAPERALMVGDTEYDAAMALAINMPALGVTTGMHDATRLRLAGAMAVLDGVGGLPGWLGSLAPQAPAP